MTAATCLWFSREDAPKAIALYEKVIPGFRVNSHRHLAGTPEQPAAECDVWEIEIAGTPYQVMGATNSQPFGMAMSISLRLPDQAAIDAVWDGLLAEGGQPMACSWIADRFGVKWQVVPQFFFDALTGDDAGRAQRAAEACWRMVKIDLAEMERATNEG